MLVDATGEPAGDFTRFKNKCEVLEAGWKLFRPTTYDFNLVKE
jgi:hypothetical protein